MSENTRLIALITGASSGLGEAFARRLSGMGYDLVLVARRAEKLKLLAAQLEGEAQGSAATLTADLSTDAGVRKVEQAIGKLSRLDLLVNNAGFGARGSFAGKPVVDSEEMLAVHCMAVVRLSHAALQKMLAERSGSIINVSSISAFAPLAGSAMYSATKVFLVNFSKALQVECRPYGIRIQALCPGFFHSEFHDVMQVDKRSMPGFLFQSAERVARGSLSALRRGRVVVTPGVFYTLATWLVRLPGLGDGLLSIFSKWGGNWRRRFLREEGSRSR